jgi:hypothetical protein
MMTDDEQGTDALIEARLRRYRPAAPPADLRRRIVPPVAPRWLWATAALLALTTVGLSWATSRVELRTAEILGDGVPAASLPGGSTDDLATGGERE